MKLEKAIDQAIEALTHTRVAISGSEIDADLDYAKKMIESAEKARACEGLKGKELSACLKG